MPQRLSAVILCVLALACDAGRPIVRVATVGDLFYRGGTGTAAEAVVPYTLTNGGDMPVFVPACDGKPLVAIDRDTAGTWEQYSGNACLAVYPQTPVELRAGETVTGQVQLLEAGRFRVSTRYGVGASSAGDLKASSNPFEVR